LPLSLPPTISQIPLFTLFIVFLCRQTITYEVPTTSTSSPLPPLSTHNDFYRRLIRENVKIRTEDGEEVEGMVIVVDSKKPGVNENDKSDRFVNQYLIEPIYLLHIILLTNNIGKYHY
jgi:hypothetical protein